MKKRRVVNDLIVSSQHHRFTIEHCIVQALYKTCYISSCYTFFGPAIVDLSFIEAQKLSWILTADAVCTGDSYRSTVCSVNYILCILRFIGLH